MKYCIAVTLGPRCPPTHSEPGWRARLRYARERAPDRPQRLDGWVVPAEAQIRMPGPVVQELMLGTWSIRVRYEPSKDMPKGGLATGREVWRLGPGGRSLIEEYAEAGAAGVVHELGVAWWDAAANGQRVFWCGDYEPPACTVYPQVARWDGNSLVQTLESDEGGRHVVRQEIFTDIKANSFTQILKAGPSTAELKTVTTIAAMRLARRRPARPSAPGAP